MKRTCVIALLVLSLTGIPHPAKAQDLPRSLALKSHTPPQAVFYMPNDRLDEELWDAFVLMRKANAGDANAEHELGLRYLIGKNFTADTVKAAGWIRKAADRNLPSARYNLGVLLNNGWGLAWNPFEAFRHFRYAAEQGMAEAEYVYGLMLTDNLVVSRDYPEAYRWVKAATDSGYAPAKELLSEFEKRGITSWVQNEVSSDSANIHQPSRKRGGRSQTMPIQPLPLSLVPDTSEPPDDKALLRDAILEHPEKKTTTTLSDSIVVPDSLDDMTKQRMIGAAEAGSPEALVIVGRWYEEGRVMQRDLVRASACYLRALRYGSPWAPKLLWKITEEKSYRPLLLQRVEKRDPIAEFVWAGLVALGVERQTTEEQALEMLEDAADQGYKEAIVDLAIRYFSGTWVSKDPETGRMLLERAGNLEARIRLWMIELEAKTGDTLGPSIIGELRRACDNGSVLAQAMLGYCHRKGVGVPVDIPQAISFYRKAAQRGSGIAYSALRQMYDEIRPNNPEFRISD